MYVNNLPSVKPFGGVGAFGPSGMHKFPCDHRFAEMDGQDREYQNGIWVALAMCVGYARPLAFTGP